MPFSRYMGTSVFGADLITNLRYSLTEFLMSQESPYHIKHIWFSKCLQIMYCSRDIWRRSLHRPTMFLLLGTGLQRNFGCILLSTLFQASCAQYCFFLNFPPYLDIEDQSFGFLAT